jgi:hypothetical protein
MVILSVRDSALDADDFPQITKHHKEMTMSSKKKTRRFKNFAKARSRDTLYRIPAGTEIIKFVADN